MRQGVVERGGDGDLGTECSSGQRNRGLDGGIERNRCGFQRFHAGEGEQPPGEVGAAGSGSLRCAHLIEGYLVVAEEALEEIEISDNDGQQIIEVVSNASGELAEGIHFLALLQLLLEAPSLRNVAGNFGCADNAPSGVFDGRDHERYMNQLSILSLAKGLK